MKASPSPQGRSRPSAARRSPAAALVATLLTCVSAAALQAATPLVAVLGKTSATVCGDCDEQVVRVAAVLRDDLATVPALTIDSVEFRGSYDTAAAKTMTPTWVLENGRPIALLVTAKPPLTRAGTYDVSVGILSSNPAERQVISLAITRLAGTLAVPATLHVDRTVRVPFFWIHPEVPKLGAIETSKHSKVTLDAITVALPFVSGTESVTGTARCTTPVPVGRGATAPVDCVVEGDFPLGTSTTSAHVHSEQLAASVPFAIEVRSRLSPWYIFVAVAAGLLVSWVLKVKLQEQIDLSSARERVDRLNAHLQDVLARNKDASFVKALADSQRDLESAITTGQATEIESKRAALEDKVKTELQQLADRRTAAVRDFEKLQTLLRLPWAVPSSIAQAIQQAATHLDEVATALDTNDVASANDALDRCRNALASELPSRIAPWLVAVNVALRDLAEARTGLSRNTKQWLDQEIAEKEPVFASAHVDNVAAKVDEIEQKLVALSTARRTFSELLLEVARRIRGESSRVRDLLDAAFGVSHEALRLLMDSASAAITLLLGLRNQPESWQSGGGPEIVRALGGGYEQAILGQLDPSKTADIRQLVDRLEYEAAAAAAATWLDANRVKAGKPASADAAPVRGKSIKQTWSEVEPDNQLGLHVVHVPGSGMYTWLIASSQSFPRSTALRAAKFRQTLGLGVVICIFGFSVYAPAFVGHWSELSGIFFWAFGLDLTLDALTRLRK
jgi:hypothetical protein